MPSLTRVFRCQGLAVVEEWRSIADQDAIADENTITHQNAVADQNSVADENAIADQDSVTNEETQPVGLLVVRDQLGAPTPPLVEYDALRPESRLPRS